MSISCFLESCEEDDTLPCDDEETSIIKLSSIFTWKKENFCVLTGNQLLKLKLESEGVKAYDLSQIEELSKELFGG